MSDQLVRLYIGQPIKNKKGNIHYRENLLEQDCRLINLQSKHEPEPHFWRLTNELEMPAAVMARAYRRRWDIAAAAAVFFLFLK